MITNISCYIIHCKKMTSTNNIRSEFLGLLLLHAFVDKVNGETFLDPVLDCLKRALVDLPHVTLVDVGVLAQLHVVGNSQDGNLMF